MAGLSRAEAAARAGVEVAYIDRLVAEGIIAPDGDGTLAPGAGRRARVIQSLEEAGLPLEELAAGFRQGILTLDFVDLPEYERFAGLSTETFADVSHRTGIPVALLTNLREALGLGMAGERDLMRDDELAVVPFVEAQLKLGFHHPSIERLMRAMGDSLRRIAEAEAEWWRAEVSEPMLERGESGRAVGQFEGMAELTARSQQAMLAIYHAQQAQTWTANIVAGFEFLLTRAGLHAALERPPAICFLDITGYTRLTQERGDQAAAELAESLARIVKRSSVEHAGRPVKWLGDGVMFIFRDAAPGVVSALEMVAEIAAAGLPPAHVGLHSGQVVVQEGDYFGQTVNMAARIAEYARPGEVLVSQAVVDAGTDARITFADVGFVDLKGVSGAVRLYAARAAARSGAAT